MIRIGVVNIDVSHPLAFSELLLKENRARYAAVYNNGFRQDDEVESFIKKHGLEKRYSSIEEMADHVDIGFVQGCNWDRHLEHAIPFIDRGKPVFIDKPIVGSVSDCMKLRKLADSGAVILGSSSVRYAEEIAAFQAIDIAERGETVSVFGTAGVDEFNYAVHIVEGICSLVGCDAVSCSYVGRSSIGGKVCETFFVRFENGVTATYNTFTGTWQPFELVTMTTKTTYQFRIDTGKIYKAMLDRICDYMETGRNTLATVPQLINSVEIMLAGRISRGNGGGEVLLSDIPDEYEGYDGDLFEKEYAAASKKIYL